jgi:hypothetical protein
MIENHVNMKNICFVVGAASFGRMSFSCTTFNIIIFCKMTFNRIKLNSKMLSRITFSGMIFSRMTFSRKTIHIKNIGTMAFMRMTFNIMTFSRINVR